ncbi:3'-5' exonuclease [Deinococcus sonorensis]|uniref:3'-5' exonuclease n=2 Tax=Deinococcus sonorensis TaxID=309891 RepID=A0AAU7UF21_9DEIO
MSSTEYVVFDLETTGLSPERDGIVEIGAMRIRDGQVQPTEIYQTLVRPTDAQGQPLSIPWYTQRVHGISDQMVRHAPTVEQVLPDFLDFVGDAAVVAHNVAFDSGFIRTAARRHGLIWQPARELCTVQLSRAAFPREKGHKLDLLAQRLGLEFEAGGRHRSLGDVRVTAEAFVQLMQRLELTRSR